MANLEGMVNKFIVIKRTDIEKYFTKAGKENLENMLENLSYNRKFDGKKDNIHLVINTDEPYADEIIEIMKRHRHWG